MFTLCAQDVAIRMARETGTLRVEERPDRRFGGTFWAIFDEHGLIEVALTEAEAKERTSV